ncbi:MAG: LPS export ABC transporter ATP-binding protein [Myxococcota bacterium]|nr:LPS export ABC transporter ATP-binding protein [Myxococcota bacterium]
MSQQQITTPRLHAKNLRKSFQRRPVVRDVSFEVSPGEIVGLLGPNGAGKTTSFRLVLGLLQPEAGSILLGPNKLDGMPLHQRTRLGLAYLPQESTVFRGLSTKKNLQAAAEIAGTNGKEAIKIADKLLEDFQLEPVSHTPASRLSGGERRRLEMARTMVTNPSIVLLDEPFAGVDPIAINEIRKFILDMRSRNIGILITDHNVRETLEICERSYIIADGSILVEGKVETVINHPEAKRMYLGSDFSMKIG